MSSLEKLTQLRQCLHNHSVQAYIVPQTDVHQNEYLPDYARRLEWLTQFTGSAGLSIVSTNHAAVFVDGRYTLQLPQQTDMNVFEARKLSLYDIELWLTEVLQSGDALGFDPWLMTERDYKTYKALCDKNGFHLKAINVNLIDEIWHDQPDLPMAPCYIHHQDYAGKTTHEKTAELCQQLEKLQTDAALITQLDSIAWLLNIRGDDTAMAPVVLSFAILHKDQTIDLFINENKILTQVRNYFSQAVRLYPYEAYAHHIKNLALQHKRIMVDTVRAPYFVIQLIEDNQGIVVRADDVCLLPKACKNVVEIEGARQAHNKDGVALVHLLAWLQQTMAGQTVTELDIVAQLKQYRRQQGAMDESFSTIVGSGPHGAIVHYRADEHTNRTLQPDDILLLDSGGQYLQGTTDVTRTMALGKTTAEQRDRFTRVLKGHIQLGMVKFPQNTSGHQLDSLARYALWQAGLDFAHGTGHGVGSFLYVHEGPQRISSAPNTVALQPGMIISNEPGYYKADEYGIRIESLVVVQKCNNPEFENEMLCFETLTVVPIDHKLIDIELLSIPERQWLNTYHQRVYTQLSPHVHSFAQEWLQAATRSI